MAVVELELDSELDADVDTLLVADVEASEAESVLDIIVLEGVPESYIMVLDPGATVLPEDVPVLADVGPDEAGQVADWGNVTPILHGESV